MDKDKRIKYANEWNESSVFFYENDDYRWCSKFLKPYNKVLEIGAGTGYSTLTLLREGHKVIAVEKNEYCFNLAKNLIMSNGYKFSDNPNDSLETDVLLILGDISDEVVFQEILDLSFDVAICWNIGTHWSKQILEEYSSKFQKYGLEEKQISDNPESSYAEFIQWKACKIASQKRVPFHIVERVSYELPKENVLYFELLKEEMGYFDSEYTNRKTRTKSSTGITLSIKAIPCNSDTMEIYLTSVLMR